MPVRTHPLVNVAKLLLADFLSTLAFVGLYAATHDIRLALILSITLGVAEIAYQRYHRFPIDPLQWLGLALVLVFGGAALFTDNPLFIKLKPTLMYTVIAIFLLKPGWMNRYVPPVVRERANDITTLFGFVWAGLFLFTALVNAFIALYTAPAVWSGFIFIFPLASKCVLVAIQYFMTRTIVRRRSGVWGQPPA